MDTEHLQNIGLLREKILGLEIIGWNANMQIMGKNFVMGVFGITACLRPI